MKVLLLLALFVATAFAAPTPLEEDTGDAVEFIVNGVAESEPLELGDVLSVKVKEHVNGQVVASSDLLHPLTAQGIAEAAALEPSPVEVNPEPIELPAPVLPDLSPEPGVVPELTLPEPVPEPVVLPDPPAPEVETEPVVVPEPVEIPGPVAPEVQPDPILVPELPTPEIDQTPAEVLPVPAPQLPNGEIFNDGVVQVTVNAPEPGMLSTVQSWFNMVLNYFNGDVQTTHQIV